VAWVLFSGRRFTWSHVFIELSCRNTRTENQDVSARLRTESSVQQSGKSERHQEHTKQQLKCVPESVGDSGSTGKRCLKYNQHETNPQLLVFAAVIQQLKTTPGCWIWHALLVFASVGPGQRLPVKKSYV